MPICWAEVTRKRASETRAEAVVDMMEDLTASESGVSLFVSVCLSVCLAGSV